MAWGGNDGAVDRWIKQLEENDPKLVSLHILSFRRINTTELTRIFKAVASNTTLKELYCSGHGLDRMAMEQLSETLTLNDTLELLNIGNATLGRDISLFSIFCEGLAVNEGLKTLDLENKGLGKQPQTVGLLVKSIQQHPTLQHVYLGRNELDDLTTDALAQWLTTTTTNKASSLRCVRLNMNAISSQGAYSIAQALSDKQQDDGLIASTLEELDLSENPLMDGAAALATQICTKCTSLCTLKMTNVCKPKEDDMQLPPPAMDSEEMERALESHNEAQLEKAAPFGNALMIAICQGMKNHDHLSSLWLDQNGIESSGLVDLDENIKGLKTLHLRENRIDNTGAIYLARCTSLQHVELGGNVIGSDGLAALLDTTTLGYVGLFNNQVRGFGHTDKPELPRFETSGVHTLDIGGNGIDLQDVEAMVRMLLDNGLPRLMLLEMGGNVEDNEMEGWDQMMKQLKDQRPTIQVTWKRLAKEMDSSKPPI
ncbi:uncharacterized protein BX664DRAFT_328103 [Halteromyces radiatus]|uniref:uncharacterized protein n=1 Tax=Halteromyces radiatus TaxID=101107 RepID=UPI00221E7B1C|nr:uncharacterized protein BX664DRAFT_328103 [Halteromyces radiatus]KAI8092772.1 hypothetical protein BX664DRAFT_328103 [Halteromyces radiatus]